MGQAGKAEKAFQPIIDVIKKYLKEPGVKLKPFADRPWNPLGSTNRTVYSYWQPKRNDKLITMNSAQSENKGCFLPFDKRRVAQVDSFTIVLDYEEGGFLKPVKPLGIMIYYYMYFSPDKKLNEYNVKKEKLGPLEYALKQSGFTLTYIPASETSWQWFFQDISKMVEKKGNDVIYEFYRYIPIKHDAVNKDAATIEEVAKMFEQNIGPQLLKNLKGFSNALGNGVIEACKEAK